MELEPQLLSILVCPETHQPLKLAPAETLQDLQARAEAGTLTTEGGRKVETLDGALVREDQQVAYLIEGGIPNLLSDERVTL